MNTNEGRRLPLALSGEKRETPVAHAPGSPVAVDPNASLEERVIAVLRTIYDPEIPVDIYELGLIYDLKVEPSGATAIRMTLTSPMCPVAEALPGEVRSKIAAVPGVTSATVQLVWEPPWDKSRMSEEAQLALGLFE
jgi:FeS assembly SUF system protein